jgi:hypothetical protein
MHTPAIIANNLSRFRGKRRSAVARLRRLAALACNRLPAESLNLVSCYTAMLLDLAGEKPELQNDMFGELKREQAGHGWACLELSTIDREFLGRIGIRP